MPQSTASLDFHTVEAALIAAETGHLVFATLHTHNAAQSIDRIVDIFPLPSSSRPASSSPTSCMQW